MILCLQTALAASAPRARQTKYGDAKWKTVTDLAVVNDAALDKILGLDPPDVIEVAKMVNPEIVSKLKSLEQGGGGWAMAGAARGKMSSVTGDVFMALAPFCQLVSNGGAETLPGVNISVCSRCSHSDRVSFRLNR